MIPGLNPRKMQQVMKQMGIQQQDIDGVQRVEIICTDRKLIIEPAQVSAVNMMGQKTYQVLGEAREEALDTTPDVNEEDVQTVMEQTGADEETARQAIVEANGDLAAAIMALQK
ncbi:nascent polypeptide-associated complex protein [Candidatus Woesearchaeota archaeon]|nr:MAG: nascent polypeptide-associated complex protein [Candidatus Woesearchaeota archaeon]